MPKTILALSALLKRNPRKSSFWMVKTLSPKSKRPSGLTNLIITKSSNLMDPVIGYSKLDEGIPQPNLTLQRTSRFNYFHIFSDIMHAQGERLS